MRLPGPVLLSVLALLLNTNPASGQGDGRFAFDDLVFGSSEKADVEAVYGGQLHCEMVAEEIEHCMVLGSVHRIEAAFANGKLRFLRMILPYGVYPEEVAADLRARFNTSFRQGVGRGVGEGLRFWLFRPAEGGVVLLEEVRSRLNNQQRVRLTLIDDRVEWYVE